MKVPPVGSENNAKDNKQLVDSANIGKQENC